MKTGTAWTVALTATLVAGQAGAASVVYTDQGDFLSDLADAGATVTIDHFRSPDTFPSSTNVNRGPYVVNWAAAGATKELKPSGSFETELKNDGISESVRGDGSGALTFSFPSGDINAFGILLTGAQQVTSFTLNGTTVSINEQYYTSAHGLGLVQFIGMIDVDAPIGPLTISVVSLGDPGWFGFDEVHTATVPPPSTDPPAAVPTPSAAAVGLMLLMGLPVMRGWKIYRAPHDGW